MDQAKVHDSCHSQGRPYFQVRGACVTACHVLVQMQVTDWAEAQREYPILRAVLDWLKAQKKTDLKALLAEQAFPMKMAD